MLKALKIMKMDQQTRSFNTKFLLTLMLCNFKKIGYCDGSCASNQHFIIKNSKAILENGQESHFSIQIYYIQILYKDILSLIYFEE